MIQKQKSFRIPFVRLLISLATVTLLIGCGAGNGQGLDENGNLLGSGGGGGGGGGGCVDATTSSGNPDATLAWVQSNVFGGVCSQCHAGGATLGVDWDSEQNTCSNVGRASAEDPSLMEIDSGNPECSHVIWKLEGQGPNGEPIIGAQMPLSNPALPAATIQNIKDWITDGTPGCSSPRGDGSTATRLDGSEVADFESRSTYTEGSWLNVWNESLRVCTICHSLTPSSPRCSVDFECPPNGVVLTVDGYSGVVDGNIVAPFDLSRSILWNRVTEENAEKRMPLGYEALTQTQLDTLQSWIEDGAPNCPENMVCP